MFERMRRSHEESPEQWENKYNVTETKYPYAFYLEDGSAYVCVHFDGKTFRHPSTKEEISIRDFVEEMKANLGRNTITLSCCYPDAAKQIIGEIPNVTVIGSGNCETQTKYNNKKGEIIVRSV
jgi:hypothetical protein